MITAAVATAFLAASTSFTGIIGQALLITVAAVVLGYIVMQLWPKDHNPALFGFLAAVSLVGGLSAFGVPAATVAIFMILAMGALSLMIGLA